MTGNPTSARKSTREPNPDQTLTVSQRELHLPENRKERAWWSSAQPASQTDGFDAIAFIRFHLGLLLRHKWLIGVSVIIVLALAVLGLARTKPLYEATAFVQVDPEDPTKVLGEKQVLSQNRVDPDYFNTQMKVLTNPSLLKQTIKQLQLASNPDFPIQGPIGLVSALTGVSRQRSNPVPSAGPPTGKSRLPGPETEAGTVPESLVEELSDNLRVTPIPRTRLVAICYQHTHPHMAQLVANGLAETFVQNNLERRVGSSKTKSMFLQMRVAELQSEIRAGETSLIEYGKQNEIVSLEPTQNTVVEQLMVLNRQLLEAQGERIQCEAAYQQVASAQMDDVSEVMLNPTVQAMRERVANLEQKLNDLRTEFTDEWYEVKQQQQLVEAAQGQLEKAKKSVINSIQLRFETARGRENELREHYHHQMGLTLSQNEKAIQYRIRQEEVATKKELYKSLLTQLKEADIAASSDANNIMLLESATLPRRPVSPNSLLTLVAAFLFSILGSSGLVVVREYLDTRLRSQEDVDKFLHLPTLGQIPSLGAPVGQPANSSQEVIDAVAWKVVEPESPGLLAAPAKTPVKTYHCATKEQEAYRQLRTSLLLSSSSDRRNQVILFTSSEAGEGKTTTSYNTAASLAQNGAGVVIIDCDLRRPSLHTKLGTKPVNGLCHYLAGQSRPHEIIEHTGFENLDAIFCEATPPNPAELLGSRPMQELISLLTETYDYVILDSPPLLAFADGAILSTQSDSVVLVVHSGRSKRELVQRACRRLEDVNAHVLGVVLNETEEQWHQYGYYGYHYDNPQTNHKTTQKVLQRGLELFKAKGK